MATYEPKPKPKYELVIRRIGASQYEAPLMREELNNCEWCPYFLTEKAIDLFRGLIYIDTCTHAGQKIPQTKPARIPEWCPLKMNPEEEEA